MHFKYIYRAAWILCVVTTVCASPLFNANGADGGYGDKIGDGSSENSRHRQKRQLSTMVWTSDFLQNLGRTFTDSVGRLREIVSSGTSTDSPLLRMVNDFRNRVAPILLRSIYTGAVQNIWDQVRKQARTTVTNWLAGSVGT